MRTTIHTLPKLSTTRAIPPPLNKDLIFRHPAIRLKVLNILYMKEYSFSNKKSPNQRIKISTAVADKIKSPSGDFI